MAPNLDPYEQKLLIGWQDVFKKVQLTFWVLLALKDSPKHMAAIKEFILKKTGHVFVVDDKSMYRALRRLNGAGIVDFITEPNAKGPERKVYALTRTGQKILNTFIQRNIVTFLQPAMQQLLKK